MHDLIRSIAIGCPRRAVTKKKIFQNIFLCVQWILHEKLFIKMLKKIQAAPKLISHFFQQMVFHPSHTIVPWKLSL